MHLGASFLVRVKIGTSTICVNTGRKCYAQLYQSKIIFDFYTMRFNYALYVIILYVCFFSVPKPFTELSMMQRKHEHSKMSQFK